MRRRSLSFFTFFAQLSLACLSGPSAIAQTTEPDDGRCDSSLSTSDVQYRREVCAPLFGCRLVVAAQRNCEVVHSFLIRLRKTVGEQETGMFARKLQVTPYALFEATLTDSMRALEQADNDAAMTAASLRRKVAAAPQREQRSILANGLQKVSYGAIGDEGLEGPGTVILSNGVIIRTESLDRAVDHKPRDLIVLATGERIINGDYYGASLFQDGRVFIGRFVDNARPSEGIMRNPDGSRDEGTWDVRGRFSKVRRYSSESKITEEGEYRDGKLYIGTKYDSEFHPSEVNIPRAEAAKQATLEAEKKRAGEEALQAFRASLNTLNAGQLYAKADELSAAGKSAEARETLRTLVARFPDHPLALPAAGQLAGRSNGTSDSNDSRATTSTAARQGMSAATGENACYREEKAYEPEVARLMAQIPPDNNIYRLKVIYRVTSRMRDIWSPCDAEKAASYERSGAAALKACQQTAANVDDCLH